MVARETDIFIVTEVENLDGMTEEARRGILRVKTQRESVSTVSTKVGLASHDKLSISFSFIEIREYPICIGDNPAGLTGTPLSIEWKHFSEVQIELEEYEKERPARRNLSGLAMGEKVRHDMLRRIGYSIVDIRSGTKPVNIDRAQRRRTVENMKLDKLHEIRENLSRNTWNALTFGGRKRKEKKLMEVVNSIEFKGKESE
jgi:hypothetical protein